MSGDGSTLRWTRSGIFAAITDILDEEIRHAYT
jgi:hypothetical protein